MQTAKRGTPRSVKRSLSRYMIRYNIETTKLTSQLELQFRRDSIQARIDVLLDNYTTDRDKELKQLVDELQALN